VARGIVREADRTGGAIFLTLDRLDPEYVHRRFPLISDACRQAGFDLATDRIPVGPAAHYLMGGVVTDVDGRTTLPGLYAAGEVACTGVHGANRLASNSLLEGLVFGARAGNAMRAGNRSAEWPAHWVSPENRLVPVAGPDLASAVGRFADLTPDEARAVMWEQAGLFRTREGLQTALTRLGAPRPDEDTIITVGRLIVRAALRREESRGGHFRLDHPQRNDSRWMHRIMETVT
jgi:L-aspartate oxidase